jgi:cytochrome c
LFIRSAALAILVGLTAPQLALAGDAAKGAAAFKKCRACHTVDEGVNRVGPSLHAIVGRPIATVDKFRYSKPMKDYAATAGTWDEEKLAHYLAAPRDVVPGTTMAFAGIKNPAEIEDLITYLKDPKAAE